MEPAYRTNKRHVKNDFVFFSFSLFLFVCPRAVCSSSLVFVLHVVILLRASTSVCMGSDVECVGWSCSCKTRYKIIIISLIVWTACIQWCVVCLPFTFCSLFYHVQYGFGISVCKEEMPVHFTSVTVTRCWIVPTITCVVVSQTHGVTSHTRARTSPIPQMFILALSAFERTHYIHK